MNGIKIRLLLVWSFLLNCNVNDMRKIDIFRYLLGFCMFGGMFSACMPSTDDIEPVRKVEIKISLQEEDFIDTRFANKEVTIRRRCFSGSFAGRIQLGRFLCVTSGGVWEYGKSSY